MEIKARNVLIGLFVLVVIVGGFGFAYWLNGTGGLSQRTAYRIEFDGPVSGLSVGSDVLFNGLKVGEVSSLDVAPDTPGKVFATVLVDSRTPVRSDTHVGLSFGALTGTASVALVGGAPSAAPLAAAGDGQPPLLVADDSALKDMTQAARDVLGRIDGVIGDNSANLKDAIANIQAFSAALGRNAGRVDGIMQGLEKLAGGGKPEIRVTYDLTAPSVFPPIPNLPTTQIVLSTPTSVMTAVTQNIVAEEGSGEVNLFPDSRWADAVPDLARARIIQGFENAHYMNVGTDDSNVAHDFTLALDFRHFHMLTAPTPTAEVEFSAKLVDSDGTVAGARIFSANAPVKAADDPVAVTGALDAAFGKAATDLIVWTLATLSSTPAEPKEPAEAPAPAEPDTTPTDKPPG
jgi:phospholipid/cholesterol/gamma-HCH transport system substrate-binding protein